MTQDTNAELQKALNDRFSDAATLDKATSGTPLLYSMAARGSCRSFLETPVSSNITDILCATALASPSKSDLQQRDIILLRSADKRQQLAGLIAGQDWVANAPMIAVFCGNNRRQRLMHDWQKVPYANDHLDAFFNSTADAAIALGAFVTAAEAIGLGCCPISAVRNEARRVSKLLNLPEHVFPVAGLAFGFPAETPPVSKRLPLRVTCHIDTYTEDGLQAAITAYDTNRAETQPYTTQRLTERFGHSDAYTWSKDKVRQYSQPERADFGDYIRAAGFNME